MDSQVLFNIAVSLAGFLGGWVLNNIYRSIERLDTDVRAMPLNYVTRDDYRADMRDVKDMLGKIFDKLDAIVTVTHPTRTFIDSHFGKECCLWGDIYGSLF